MPSELKPDAKCLECGKPMLFVARTWHHGRGKPFVHVEMHHEDKSHPCHLSLPEKVGEALAQAGAL